MRSRWSALILLGVGLVVLAALPGRSFAQNGPPDIAGSGNLFVYTSDNAPPAPTVAVDQILALRLSQLRVMASRWLSAPRAAGARLALRGRLLKFSK